MNQTENLNCRCCGGILDTNSNLCVCKYCGTTNFVSNVASKYITQLNRANKLRQECEFDNAARIYDTILEENEPTADILWFRTLCEYGIEYVPDPVTEKYFPTLHRINDESILEYGSFKQAIELSEGKQKETFLKEAEYIDEVQNKYLNIAANEDPYDVFICYKETDLETGEKTEDVILAEELYNELTDMGYKVFFARVTLMEKLSVDYEPYIFAALKSAKAMAVIGTKAEYFASVWVKNEWGRFFKLMEKNPEKQMFFACDDPEELPRAFASKQAQILSEDNAIKNLAANIGLFLKAGELVNSKRTIDQEEFDRIIEVKSKEYVERIDKTEFGEKERNVRESIWKSNGKVQLNNKIYTNTFHIGSLLIIVTELISSVFFATSIGFPVFYYGFLENNKASLVFGSVLMILFLSGTATILSPRFIIKACDDVSQESFLFIPIVAGQVLLGGIILSIVFYGAPMIIIVAYPLVIIIGGLWRAFIDNFFDNKKAASEAKSFNRKLQALKGSAEKEFFEFAEKQLEDIKQNNDVKYDVEVKDYHYDNVKTKISEMIEKDKQFIVEDTGMQAKNIKIWLLVYSLIAAFFTVIMLLILDI